MQLQLLGRSLGTLPPRTGMRTDSPTPALPGATTDSGRARSVIRSAVHMSEPAMGRIFALTSQHSFYIHCAVTSRYPDEGKEDAI
ncbi:hypothetical protein E5288_WYG006427 [Bos mutus]|uniref:Uncharacterized protein n=1 Tax=Bos mutus TaxID=72004 RepID=A0A6B0QTG3_9CETA|nr:hypothetical protein [Bos mutus]